MQQTSPLHPSTPPSAGRRSLTVVAGNKGSTGPFAPIVNVTRNAMGTKQFNQFRGKAISLHSQGKGLLPSPFAATASPQHPSVRMCHARHTPTPVALVNRGSCSGPPWRVVNSTV